MGMAASQPACRGCATARFPYWVLRILPKPYFALLWTQIGSIILPQKVSRAHGRPHDAHARLWSPAQMASALAALASTMAFIHLRNLVYPLRLQCAPYVLRAGGDGWAVPVAWSWSEGARWTRLPRVTVRALLAARACRGGPVAGAGGRARCWSGLGSPPGLVRRVTCAGYTRPTAAAACVGDWRGRPARPPWPCLFWLAVERKHHPGSQVQCTLSPENPCSPHPMCLNSCVSMCALRMLRCALRGCRLERKVVARIISFLRPGPPL